jgi:hypothetical protein
MKKYLMTGVAALAFAATFTSCSKTDLYDENKVNEQKEATVNEKYAAAFEKAFGKVGANVDWGFSSQAKTRSVDVNGNLWKTRPAVTAAEAAAVYAWVNRPKSEIPENSYYEESPVNMKNFFVTQVWGSDDNEDDPNCRYLNGDQMVNAAKGQTYNLTDKVWGSTKMNHLQISTSSARLGDGVANLDAATWDHANNFNAGQNRDWDGNTMFVDWGTQNFAYHSTEDSKYHDKWIIVDGSYITDSKGVNHAGQYYVCFDFIATNPEIKTKFRAWVPGNNPGEVLERGPFEVNGAYTMETAIEAGVKITVEGKEYTISDQTINQNGTERPMFAIEGYVGGNKYVPANNYYTDWIVRLVEAKPKKDPLYRVIAEDLTADEAGDFDFNDVVFDVVKYEGGVTTLRLQACGGTLPLRIGSTNGNGGVEVHSIYGDTTPDATTGKYKMWNTGLNSHEPVDFTISGKYTTPEELLNLRIEVQKGETWMLLTANKGVAACKILVDDRFEPIVPERHSIADKFGNFTTYVQGNWKSENDNFWWVQE